MNKQQIAARAARIAELVAAVRQHAIDHYEEGWDAIVECWTDEDIAETIGRARTVAGALRKFAPLVDAWSERQAACVAAARAAYEEAIGTTAPVEVPVVPSPAKLFPWALFDDDYGYWLGVTIDSPGYCDHREATPEEPWAVCWQEGCRHRHSDPF